MARENKGDSAHEPRRIPVPAPSSARTVFAAAILLLLSGFWLYSAAFHAFDDDEFQHLQAACSIHNGATPYLDFFEHHLVLYHAVVSPFFLLGEAFWQIFVFRAFSLLCGALSLLVLFRCGRRMGFSSTSCGTGILLAGLCPFFVLKMTEARPEAPAILAISCALYLLFDRRHGIAKPWRDSILFGGMLSCATLLSQKYAIICAALSAAYFFVHGWRSTARAFAIFAAAIAGYCLAMLAIGVGSEAFDAVIVMNMRWKMRFSPANYLSELFLSSGPLAACGTFGILANFAEGRRRRQSFAILLLMIGATMQISLVPVPYRQSFLPLILVLALGSISFLSRLFAVMRGSGLDAMRRLMPLLLAASSISSLAMNLKNDNRADIRFASRLDNPGTGARFFDGRALMFFRPQIGYYGWMHEELLMMLDKESYSGDTVSVLRKNGLPPVIDDYRVKMMPEGILTFISENYVESDLPGLLVPGRRMERIQPGRRTSLRIPVSGEWLARWEGASLTLDGNILQNGESLHLEEGEHLIESDGLAWNFKIERNLGAALKPSSSRQL